MKILGLALALLLPLEAQQPSYTIVIERTRGTQGTLELRIDARSVHRCPCWEASSGRIAARVVPGCSATTRGKAQRPVISLAAGRIGRKGIFIKGGTRASITPGSILVAPEEMTALHAAIGEKDGRNVTVRIRSVEVAEAMGGLRRLRAEAERAPALTRERTVLENLMRLVDLAHDADAAERLVVRHAFFKAVRDKGLETALNSGAQAGIEWIARKAGRKALGFATVLVHDFGPAELGPAPREVLQARRSGPAALARAGARLLAVPRTPEGARRQDALLRLLLHRLGYGVPAPPGLPVR
jgi:hypothetical protein